MAATVTNSAIERALILKRKICTCKRLTPRPLRPRRPRRMLQRRPPGIQLNTCFTGWPGGLSYTPPGQALAPGNLFTGFEGGFPTNPRCYPPRLGPLLDASNDGSFRGARRAAILAHRNPDTTANEIGGLIGAIQRGTLTPEIGLRRINDLAAPPTQISQALAFRPAETLEERRERQARQQTGPIAQDAIDAELADASCRPTWCCYDGETFSTSQNRGVTKDRKVVARNRARGFKCRILDTGRLATILGHKPSADEELGGCADDRNLLIHPRGGKPVARPAFRRSGSISFQEQVTSPTQPAPLPPAPAPEPTPTPAPATRTPGDGPDNCIVIERLFDQACFRSPVDGRWYIIRGTA